MRFLTCILFLLFLAACRVPSLKVRPAPLPTQAEVDALRVSQSRILEAPLESVFPKVLEVLLDAGYQIRCSDRTLGLVSVSQVWLDTSQMLDINQVQEGTILFQAEGVQRTRVRVVLSGKWEFRSTGGPKSADAMVSEVVQRADRSVHQHLLDVLEKGLRGK